MADQEWVLQASVAGVAQFEQDTKALTRALQGIRNALKGDLVGNLGSIELAQMREQAAAIGGELAQRKAQSTKLAYNETLKQAKAAPAGSDEQVALATKAKALETQSLAAEKALLNARAGLAKATEARVKAEGAAAKKVEDAAAKEAKASEKAAEAKERRAAREGEAAKKREAREAEAAKKRAAADAQATKQAQQLAKAQQLSPQRVQELTKRLGQNPDPTSTGVLSSQQIAASNRVLRLDQDIAKAKAQALAGAVPQAESEQRLRLLTDQRVAAGQRLVRLTQTLESALQKHADAENLAAESARQGFLGKQVSGFRTGFKGTGGVSYAQQAGQAAKFSVLYGSAYAAMSAITQSLALALSEGIAFQQGLSDMSIATGRPKAELTDLAERLSTIATNTGTSASQGLEIGQRAIGLYGLSGSDKPFDQQAYVAELSTQVISKAAMGQKDVDPVQMQANIAAVTQALGLGAGGQIRVADLDQYFSREFGTKTGQTLEAASQSASVGVAAGFTPEEIQAIAAQMISRTGQSSNAVGGYMAQIFSRGGEGSLSTVASKYGIDTNGRALADVFRDLSTKYNSSGQQEKQEISAAFGRGKVQNAVVATLEDWSEIAKKAKKAENGAADGSLDKAFTERLNNIGGMINILQGHLKEFAHLFGESGLLSIVGFGVMALDKMVTAVNSVLALYNELNPVLREFIAVLLAGALAGKATGATGAIRGLARGELPTALATRFGIRSAGPQLITEGAAAGRFRNAAGQFAAAPVASSEAVAVGKATQVGASGIAAAGKAALLTVGPWVAAGAGLLAIADVAKVLKENAALTQNSLSALNQDPGPDASPDQLRTQASQLKAAAAEQKKSGDWFTQAVTLGHGNDGQVDMAKGLEKEAKRLNALAKNLKVANPESKPLAGFDQDSLTKGLDAITNQGGSATDRIKALAEAINGLGAKSSEVAGELNAKALSGTLAKAARSLKGELNIYTDPNDGLSWGTRKKLKGGVNTNLTRDVEAGISKELSGTEVAKRTDAVQKELGITNASQITPEIAKKMAARIGKLTSKYGKIAGVQDFVDQQIAAALLKQKTDLDRLKVGAVSLSDGEVVSTLNSIATEYGNKLGARGDTDYAGKIADAKAQLRLVRQTKAKAGNKDLPAIAAATTAASNTLAENQINQLQALRAVAVQNATSQSGATRAARPLIRQMLAVAIKSGTADQLAAVLATAGKGAITLARNMIDAAIKVARTARLEAQKLVAAANTERERAGEALAVAGGFTIGTGPGQVVPGVVLGAKKPALSPKERDLKKKRRSLLTDLSTEDPDKASGETAAQIAAARNAAGATNKGAVAEARAALVSAQADLNEAKYHSVAWWQAYGAVLAAQKGVSDAVRAVGTARSGAAAARNGGQIAGARAQIVSAKADMDAAAKGSAEWYQALASYYSARDSLADAIASYRHNVRSLAIDTTDPVAVAQLALKEAREKLRRDARKGKDVKAEDRTGVKDAGTSLEAAAFSQKLSDVQTAENLGRISHAAYLRYLQSEHNRLNAIGKRTRQQQDQLNQIDGLMQEATKAMQGAWNIGDIKLPTPYEVRKYVKENAGLTPNNRQAAAQTTVYINGADTGLVKKVIAETVGKNAQVMTVTPRRT